MMEMSRVKDLAGRLLWFCLLLICIASPCIFAQQAPSSAPAASSADKPQATPVVPSLDFHEDWSAITRKGSDLHALHPILGEQDDVRGATFIRERYQMLWRPDDPLDVFVVRPRGLAKPPVILYLYSFPQDTDRFKDNRWCETVTSNGYAAVGFVSELTGHRIHDRPAKEWFVSELQESLATSTHDVEMILDYLVTRSDMDMDHVGMFGVGSGGAIAILAAAADSRIKALELLSSWGDWPDWLAKSSVVPQNERAAYLRPEFLARVAPLDPMVWLPTLKTQAIRIQNVRESPTIPDECQKRIEAVAPATSIVDQFADARTFYPASGGGKVFDWLKDQLRPDGKATTVAANSPGVHYYPPLEQPTLPALPVPK
jgi:hypothetical protein